MSPRNLLLKFVNLGLDRLPSDRVLGVSWDPNSDMLTFEVVNKNIPETERGMPTMISLIFDIMALISPIIIKTKLLIQAVCRQQT